MSLSRGVRITNFKYQIILGRYRIQRTNFLSQLNEFSNYQKRLYNICKFFTGKHTPSLKHMIIRVSNNER